MIRLVLLVLLALFVVWCGTSVKLGEYTCAGHVQRIWKSDEAQDLKEGVKEKATSESTKEMVNDLKETTGPAVERVKRGVKAGVQEATDGETADRVKAGTRETAGEVKEGTREAADKVKDATR